MALLDWKPEYSVGIEAVDWEHRQLVDLINELHEEIDGSDAQQVTQDFLGELLRAISAHFALEEKIMRDQDYGEYASHKADHERLIDELREIMDFVAESETLAGGDLTRRLEAWFSTHFRTHDARLHRAIGDAPVREG